MKPSWNSKIGNTDISNIGSSITGAIFNACQVEVLNSQIIINTDVVDLKGGLSVLRYGKVVVVGLNNFYAKTTGNNLVLGSQLPLPAIQVGGTVTGTNSEGTAILNAAGATVWVWPADTALRAHIPQSATGHRMWATIIYICQ